MSKFETHCTCIASSWTAADGVADAASGSKPRCRHTNRKSTKRMQTWAGDCVQHARRGEMRDCKLRERTHARNRSRHATEFKAKSSKSGCRNVHEQKLTYSQTRRCMQRHCASACTPRVCLHAHAKAVASLQVSARFCAMKRMA
eukprot:5467795-Pleurochrysis_carterae.AAC.1